MSESYISNVSFHEQRFIGQSVIYDSSVVNIPSIPFTYSMNVPSSLPNPETSVTNITVTGVDGSDSNGTTYSGQFRIKRNSSTSNPAITISGVGLTASQISLIRSSISIVETPPSGGFDDLATVTVSLFPIARAGIRNFDITIPFEDSHISIPTNTIQIPFLTFDGSRADSSFVNPISVSVDNGELTINAGDLPQTLPALRLARNWPSTRNITSAILNYDSNEQIRYLTIDGSESLSNVNAIKFIPQNIPTLPSSDSSGFTTDMNYNVQISTQLWKPFYTPISYPINYYSSNYDYRLYYVIKYGIGRLNNGVVFPGEFFNYAPYLGGNCSETVERTGTFDNPTITITWQCSDNNPPNRNAFTVTNNNGNIADIELSIDRLDSSNNVFRIHSILNFADFTFTYSGFSGDMFVEDFINNVKAEIVNQCNAWTTRFRFDIDSIFKYAKMKDFPSTSVDNIANGQRVIFDISPEHRGESSFTFSLTVYEASSNTNLSVGQLMLFLKNTFGSYGLIFNRNIPDTTEWMNLKAFPTIIDNNHLNTNFLPGPSLNTRSFSSNPSAFLNMTITSSHRDQYNTGGNAALRAAAVSLITYTGYTTRTLSVAAGVIQSTINNAISLYQKSYIPTNTRNLTISCEYPSYYADVLTSYLKVSNGRTPTTLAATYTGRNPPPSTLTGIFDRFINSPSSPTSPTLSTGNSINGSFSSLRFNNNALSFSYQIPISPLNSLESLVNEINSNSQPWNSIVIASLIDSSYASNMISSLSSINNWNLSTGNLNVLATITVSFIRRYRLDQYSTLQNLVSAIQLDFSSNIDVAISSATNNHSGVTPSHLVTPAVIQNIKTSPLPKTLLGIVYSTPTPITPTYDVKLNYNIGFASTAGGGQPKVNGLQVAIGGYEKGGVFYPYKSPNAFFEPVYNTKFPISFTTIDADIVYLLIRTRESLVNGPTSYSSNYNCYSGLVQYSNGYNPYSLVPFIPGESKFTSVWDENTVGVPTVVAVPVYSTVMDVSLEDNCIFDSVSVQIINKPSAIDDFGFLAINRTNNNKSQMESKRGKTFGLVLDNRGSWDVMISPEAIMHLNSSGSISYLGSFYSREILGDDEGYDFSIITSLPDTVKNSISISPVPGNPQVWVLRVEHGVKKYLGALIAARNDQESLDGCFIDIDLLIKGRTTGVEGTARVTIYYDYTCVYDIGLCDFFWNLIDPPKPTGPEIIQNRLEFAYETLVDCSNLTTPIGNNVAVNAPILLTITNIPTFINGNALLLIKSSYTSEVQGFYFPVGNQLDALQFSTCSDINSNLPLMQRLNREFLLLPNNPTPVTDSFHIQSMLQTEESYLYVKPQFSFPPDDNIKDCNNNEIVIVGIGYVFKNWNNGTRQDDIVFGTHLLFPQDLYASPEINICYRYYYNQKKT